jgi:SPP1 gp7 family putative phage head morphogenesis protein
MDESDEYEIDINLEDLKDVADKAAGVLKNFYGRIPEKAPVSEKDKNLTKIRTELLRKIKQIYMKESLKAKFSSKSAFSVGIDPLALDALYKRTSDMVNTASDISLAQAHYIVLKGFIDGKDWRDIKRDILESLPDFDETHAENFSHAEVMFAVHAAQLARYKASGVQHVEWLTASDHWASPVCELCKPLSGRIFSIDNVPPCPVHPDCRCTLLPVKGKR